MQQARYPNSFASDGTFATAFNTSSMPQHSAGQLCDYLISVVVLSYALRLLYFRSCI